MLLPLALLCHLADDGEHRPLDGTFDRPVRGIAGTAERLAQERRAHSFVLAEHLDEAAHDLGEDDSRVAARTHERRSGHVLGHRVARRGSRRIERLDDRAKRQDEVRPGVAVRYGIDVEVVDPPTMSFEVPQRASGEVSDDLELHQWRTPSMWTSSEAIGRPTMRSSSYWTRDRTVSATSASRTPCSTTTRNSTTRPSSRRPRPNRSSGTASRCCCGSPSRTRCSCRSRRSALPSTARDRRPDQAAARSPSP